ncbi:Protein CBG21754 [Caenorhabditis briggsae]|uniref:Protein CBG21754 n=2 Tax=Caenorhabditis briggsae TaxID=6238 RepID=A8Y0K4_CAEBR|nr:Protein CBG21754 [Caenorhabditis briggsae]ULT94028.1 hypothetical protein L3Y34_003483 [Caenorhabditis briggsae]CAP38422.1 Protein CBG21754 [Caenorhabditis briggsae]
MIRVSASKWMLLALLSVMVTTNSADTALEAELGHPDVQNAIEGVRFARASNANTTNGTTVNNPSTKTKRGKGHAGGAGVSKQPSKPSTTEPPPDTNNTITVTNATPAIVETTNATTTTPTTPKTTEATTPTTEAPQKVSKLVVTPAPPPTTTSVPTVTTLLPNNNNTSPTTNSTQMAPNTSATESTTSSIASQTPPPTPVLPPGGSAQTSTSPSTDEQDPGTGEYEPPHEDLPDDFSCQNLGEKYKACEYLCQQLAGMKPYKAAGMDWRFLPGVFLSVGSSVAIIILFVLTKKLNNELAALNEQKPTAADDPNAKLKIAYAAALDVKDPKNPEKKEEKIQEVPSPPSLKNNPAAQKMRAKLLETQQNLQKLRTHAKKCVEEHKKDAASSKFQKKGAIYIPNEPEIPPPAPLPDNIILDNVEWCSDYNEMYVIGSDVDDIELDQDYVMNPDSFTTDDDEDKSKKSQKSKNSKKSKKSVKSKKSKKDVPSTSGAPSAAPPPSTTSAPSTSTPSVDAKRESNQNKSKEQQ